MSSGNFINLAPYLLAPGQLSDFWFPLGGGETSKDRNKPAKGQLRLQIQWVPQDTFQGKPKRAITRGFLQRINDTRAEESTPDAVVAKHDGEVCFKIIRARRLVNVQSIGQQDPYVRLVLMEGGGCVPQETDGGGDGVEGGGAPAMVAREMQLTETETKYVDNGG